MVASSSSSARSHLSLWVFAVLVVAACGGDDSPSDGDRDAGRDAARADGSVGIDGAALDGATPGDGAIPTDDTGTGAEGGPTDDGGTAGEGGTTDDGGTPTDDGGTPTDDGGTPTDDGGTPTDDGGTPTDDGGTPTDDGGTPTDDAGPPPGDSGPGIDAGPAPDAGPRDAGSGGCFTNADCLRRGEFCETASCGGPGICLATPDACSGVFDPVCGCDGITYSNDCVRQRAAVGRAALGACSGTCDLRPSDPACCFEPADCASRANDCVVGGGEPMCIAGGEGVCKADPPAGRCWDDDDCDPRAGETCNEPIICPCGAACVRPDDPGFCLGPVIMCDARPTIDGCCFDDADCGDRQECRGEDCAAGTPGRCLRIPERGQCWEDADCGSGTCFGGRYCACGAAGCGPLADNLGTCLGITPGG